MRKKILLAILLPVTVIMTLVMSLTVFESFELNVTSARLSALREETVIARSVQAEMEGIQPSYADILRVAQGLRKYATADVSVMLLYNGAPMAGAELPEEIRISSLMETRSRSTYLSSREEKVYVARALSGNITLMTVADMSSVYKTRRAEQRTAVRIGVLGLGVAVALSLILSGRLTKPLKQLTDAADELCRGNYAMKLPETGKDEIGHLTAAFSDMAEAVGEREHSLALQAERKQEMLDALAHEMRTPLTAIVGAADLIPQKPEAAPDMARLIRNEAMRLSALDENLMTLTRMNSDAPEFFPFSALECAREAVECFPTTVLEGNDVEWSGDRELILLLLRNLTANAWRSGTTEPVRLRILPDGFDVSDKGCGMTEEESAHAFEAFWKADPARTRKNGGAGLGLTLCARIAELHQGTLTLDSRPGEGTTVSFRFTNPLHICEDPET